jgi:hypothetical protein
MRNFVAKELRSNPKFRAQVVRNKKAYSRKQKHRKVDCSA